MKTLDWVIAHYNELECDLDKRFIVRLADYLSTDQCRAFGCRSKRLIPYNKENIQSDLKRDLLWGWEKANGKRGLSAVIGYDLVRAWNIILDDGLEGFTDYEPYGMPLFQATAARYGWELPVYEHKHYDMIKVLLVRPLKNPELIEMPNKKSQVNKYTCGNHIRIPYNLAHPEYLILANEKYLTADAGSYNRTVYSDYLKSVLKQISAAAGNVYNPADAYMRIHGDFLISKYDTATDELIPLSDEDIKWFTEAFSNPRNQTSK